MCQDCWSFAYLVWPALLLYNIIGGELLLADLDFLESEYIDAIGQWSNFVLVAVTLLIAMFTRLYRKISEAEHTTEDDEFKPLLYTNVPPNWILGWRQGWFHIQLIRLEW